MEKRHHDFAKIAEFKARFRHLSVEELENKRAVGFLQKEASAAIRELLREKAAVEPSHGDAAVELRQRAKCRDVGAEFLPTPAELKVGIALATLHLLPLNALRHVPVGDTSGWYIWGGEDLSKDPSFFHPLHAAHLSEHCPDIVDYLGLAPGWRVLLAGEQVDVWYDLFIVVA